MLEVRGLRSVRMVEPVDLTVRRGEIVGLAGLLGSGRTSLLKAIFGADRIDSGSIELDGEVLKLASPRAAARPAQRPVRSGPRLAVRPRRRAGCGP